MSYSLDFRERVVKQVHSGSSVSEVSRLFGISRRTLHYWLRREDLSATKVTTRHNKLDMGALDRHVTDHPDLYLRERAAHFGVQVSTMHYALKRLQVCKKNDEVRRKKPQ